MSQEGKQPGSRHRTKLQKADPWFRGRCALFWGVLSPLCTRTVYEGPWNSAGAFSRTRVIVRFHFLSYKRMLVKKKERKKMSVVVSSFPAVSPHSEGEIFDSILYSLVSKSQAHVCVFLIEYYPLYLAFCFYT